jgi:hypothetical protein
MQRLYEPNHQGARCYLWPGGPIRTVCLHCGRYPCCSANNFLSNERAPLLAGPVSRGRECGLGLVISGASRSPVSGPYRWPPTKGAQGRRGASSPLRADRHGSFCRRLRSKRDHYSRQKAESILVTVLASAARCEDLVVLQIEEGDEVFRLNVRGIVPFVPAFLGSHAGPW